MTQNEKYIKSFIEALGVEKKIVNENFKDKEFNEIDELIYEFNSGGIKISNWIELKNFTNKVISSYSG